MFTRLPGFFPRPLAFLLILLITGMSRTGAQQPEPEALTVVALGDVGDLGSDWRGSAFYITDMFTGRHDAGKPDVLLFLGDNFMPLGLNGPADDVDATVADLFRPLKEVVAGISRDRIHAIPGEHDYYSRFAEEKTALFGLIRTSEVPTGISDKGNMREAAIESWTYHHGMADQAVVGLGPGSTDSVQFIFLDSALPLRTDPSQWHAGLSSLRGILAASSDRRGILWRVLCVHHPWYSLGVHGGYSTWNEEDSTVGYLTNCDKDSNATAFLRNWLDPEDLCADRYQRYVDSVRSIIQQEGVRIQFILSAHDRSLQIISHLTAGGESEACPTIQIISGAGSLRTRVRRAAPPLEFTSSPQSPGDEGVSVPGFVQLRFERDRVRVQFFSSRNGDRLDMGGGQSVFWIDRKGRLRLS